MSMKLTPKEQEKRVLDNMNLVYYMVNKLQHVNPSDYDDFVQMGRIGLIKAAATFDDEKGIKFATYAGKCINNEFYMYFRKERQHCNDISMSDKIYIDRNGNELMLDLMAGLKKCKIKILSLFM